jgi:D-alanyl-D-alanine carboxypeptidase (penicillin-binding protein 5/6)
VNILKKFKSLLIFYTVIIFVTNAFFYQISYADDEEDNDNLINNEIVKENLSYIENEIKKENENKNLEQNNETKENRKIIETSTENVEKNKRIQEPKQLNSRRYAIYDRASGTCMYGKNENKQTAMASTTKIMTAIIVLENCKNLDEVVTISAKAAGTGGSKLGLKKDDKVTVNDLLFGLLMRSGNDAAVALANYTAGSVENFANMMNKKAQELGLVNTHFVTPHGLDNPNHYTTAYELAKLADYALKNDKFATIVKTKYVTIKINDQQKELKNTNELLLADVEGVYGVKTGFTGNAGRCLVTSVKRNNMDLIIVVLGADTRKDRAKDTLKLIDYAFKGFKMKSIEEIAQEEYVLWKNANENRIKINKGSSKLKTKLGDIKIKQIATNKELSAEVHNINYIEAPVEAGSKVGEIIIKNGDNIIEKVDIEAKNSIQKNNVKNYFELFARYIAVTS